MRKQRFKHPDINRCYWLWAEMDVKGVAAAYHPGSNREQAFKAGFLGYTVPYGHNTPLYAIYIAGKEWCKINPSLASDPLLQEMNAHKSRLAERKADHK